MCPKFEAVTPIGVEMGKLGDIAKGYEAERQYNEDGTTTGNIGNYISEWVPVKTGQVYQWIQGRGWAAIGLLFFDANKNFIQSIYGAGKSVVTTTIPEGVAFIRLSAALASPHSTEHLGSLIRAE